MALFINVEISEEKCAGLAACGQCVKVCPVQIFGEGGERPSIIDDNLDECTLCELCLQKCEPGAITLCKLYEE